MARPRNLLTNRSTRFRPPFTSRWRTSWNRSRRFLPTSSPGAGGLSATPLAVFDAELGARAPVYSGGLRLPGVTGSYVSCPDTAAVSVTGDLEIVVRTLPSTAWNGAAGPSGSRLLAKGTSAAASTSYAVYIDSSAQLALLVSDGATNLTHTSTASVPFSTGQAGWLKWTIDVDDGAGNRVVKFHTAADSATEPSAGWSQLGATVTTAGAITINDTAVALIVGDRTGLDRSYAGTIYRAIVRNGIGGTVVADFDATRFADGRPDFVDDYSNRWTLYTNSEPGYGCLQDAMLPVGGYPQVGLGYITIAAGQSIGCTAPAGTASYLATRHDSTTTAGAAAPGAFTFTTAGSWRSVQLLDAGATEVALFQASAVPWPARGHTDAYSVAWTVNGWTPTMVGHAQLGSTAAANTNTPKMLYRADQAYVWLPGTAGNTISCTAPAGTASYSAVDAFTGTATTGAAAPGAFTLQTLGQWSTVSLLDAGAVELARFDANLSTQTGHTDTYSVAWTINRATAGKKSTLVTTRAVASRGTDDYWVLPVGATPTMGATTDWTVVHVGREWATPVSNGRLVDTRANATATTAGMALRNDGTNLALIAEIGDGANTAATAATTTVTAGTKVVASITGSAAGATLTARANTSSTTAVASGVGSRTASPIAVGRVAGTGTNYSDAEDEAAITVQAALSAADHGRLTAHYAGGT